MLESAKHFSEQKPEENRKNDTNDELYTTPSSESFTTASDSSEPSEHDSPVAPIMDRPDNNENYAYDNDYQKPNSDDVYDYAEGLMPTVSSDDKNKRKPKCKISRRDTLLSYYGTILGKHNLQIALNYFCSKKCYSSSSI